MSRSNPVDSSPNPCTRWHQWNGERGVVLYYDKEKEETIDVKDGFSFILLDQTATIKGWHDASDSGIFSNEVKDTRSEPFIVKAFKGGKLAEGIYASIRDRVIAAGGHFTSNCYIAFRPSKEDPLTLGSIQFKGAALSAWMEFCKEHRLEVWKKAVRIKGFNEGKKGKITFRTPIFHIADVTEQTEKEAQEMDKELQTYLAGYFKRTKTQQVEDAPAPADTEPEQEAPPYEPEPEERETSFDPDSETPF